MSESLYEKQKREREEREAWLKSLTEGSEVAVSKGSFGYRYYEIVKVVRITPTGRITTSDGIKYDNFGFEMGKKDTWSPKYRIIPVTPEIIEEIRRKEILETIQRTNFKEFSLESLEVIHATIQKEEANKEKGN